MKHQRRDRRSPLDMLGSFPKSTQAGYREEAGPAAAQEPINRRARPGNPRRHSSRTRTGHRSSHDRDPAECWPT